MLEMIPTQGKPVKRAFEIPLPGRMVIGHEHVPQPARCDGYVPERPRRRQLPGPANAGKEPHRTMLAVPQMIRAARFHPEALSIAENATTMCYHNAIFVLRRLAMPQILVRDLDDVLVERLKRQAKRHHRSLQGEVKAILIESARMTPEEMLAAAESWQR